MLKHIAQQIGHQIEAEVEDDDFDAIRNTFEEPTESSTGEIRASRQVGLRHVKKFVGLKEKRDSDEL